MVHVTNLTPPGSDIPPTSNVVSTEDDFFVEPEVVVGEERRLATVDDVTARVVVPPPLSDVAGGGTSPGYLLMRYTCLWGVIGVLFGEVGGDGDRGGGVVREVRLFVAPCSDTPSGAHNNSKNKSVGREGCYQVRRVYNRSGAFSRHWLLLLHGGEGCRQVVPRRHVEACLVTNKKEKTVHESKKDRPGKATPRHAPHRPAALKPLCELLSLRKGCRDPSQSSLDVCCSVQDPTIVVVSFSCLIIVLQV